MTVLVGAFLASGAVNAQIGPDPKTNARHSRIVGLWDVDVVIANCATGVPVGAFKALHKYELGGTGQVVPGTNPAGLSEHSMIWSHVRDNDYRMAIKFFRFDANGVNVGWNVIRNEISISPDGNEYVGGGVAEVYDINGNFLFASCPSFIGTRFAG
ncbi:MAG: hypothetical protein R3212_01290 [Xanthomonadales bacterium]|nr:hypothetical protein [Xanthomonadales bacterium]